jgi:hypothetical protein
MKSLNRNLEDLQKEIDILWRSVQVMPKHKVAEVAPRLIDLAQTLIIIRDVAEKHFNTIKDGDYVY